MGEGRVFVSHAHELVGQGEGGIWGQQQSPEGKDSWLRGGVLMPKGISVKVITTLGVGVGRLRLEEQLSPSFGGLLGYSGDLSPVRECGTGGRVLKGSRITVLKSLLWADRPWASLQGNGLSITSLCVDVSSGMFLEIC